MFEISNEDEFLKKYPEFETYERFLNFTGPYELHGFKRYDGGELKMGSTIDRQHQLNPIWGRKCSRTDSQYFIFFNQTRTRWELHEMKIIGGSFEPISYDHNQLWQQDAYPWLLDCLLSRSEKRSDQSRFWNKIYRS